MVDIFCGAFAWPFKVLFGQQGRPPYLVGGTNKKSDDGFQLIENDIESNNPKDRLASVLGACEIKIKNARVKHEQVLADSFRRREAAKVELKKGTASGKANAQRLMGESVKLSQEAESLQLIITSTTDRCSQLERTATRDDLLTVLSALTAAQQSLHKDDPDGEAFKHVLVDTKNSAAALADREDELNVAMKGLGRDRERASTVNNDDVSLKERAEEEMHALEAEIQNERAGNPTVLVYTPPAAPAAKQQSAQSRYPPVPKSAAVVKKTPQEQPFELV